MICAAKNGGNILRALYRSHLKKMSKREAQGTKVENKKKKRGRPSKAEKENPWVSWDEEDSEFLKASI